MKRISSFILAFIISITCIFSAGVSYADNRPHIEDALNNLQTQVGYIPFQNSSVQYNCFGFISDVCARLYSVTYYYEQQVGNYRFNHTSNYFTVSQATFPDSSYAKALKEWLCANAAVGDVLQIGCANDNDSKKHTVLIQYIDDEKIMLYHSNYATSGISSSVCRIDTVYWKSFIANPTSNKSNSLNLLLGSNFRRSGGVGMSLNRYSFLEQYYQLDSLTKYTSEITKTERDSSTSVKIYFKQIPDATAYSVQYRASDSNKWITASNNVTALNYSVKNLTTGAAYEIEATQQDWSVRELSRQVGSCLYERLVLSRNKEEVMRLSKEGQTVEKSSDVIKNPLTLEFLGLNPDTAYSESKLENAIINKMQQFLLELGKGFLFEARQKRFTFDEQHFFVDLVFYNRLLQCYVLIDLKMGKLTHQDLGQMQMYVNYYDRHIKQEFEKPTIGILLCERKNDALVELTLPKDANVYAAAYQLYLPDKALLQAKVKEWIEEFEENEEIKKLEED